jgi:two-component system OmpR family sensor kinase
MVKNDGWLPEARGLNADVEKLSASEAATTSEAKDKLIDELREAITARDDFLAIVAHELRNPLTPILLCAQHLRRAKESGSRSKWLTELDRLERLIKHFASRTQMLLEVARITTKKFKSDEIELNLSQLIADIVNDYRPMIVRSGSEIITLIEKELTATADPMVISEILENLLSNAIKYGKGNPIELTLTSIDELVQIIVRDNGIGIAPVDQERIFNRFERAIRHGPNSGFGIGLWLVRNLAESMGGSITVVGNVGQGSVFTVSLPIKAKEIHE